MGYSKIILDDQCKKADYKSWYLDIRPPEDMRVISLIHSKLVAQKEKVGRPILSIARSPSVVLFPILCRHGECRG
jgi:hypothetical protein